MPEPIETQPQEASLGKTSASGAAWAGLSRTVQQVTQTVSVFVLARLLTAEDYGLMSASGFFVNFLQQLGDMGTGSAIIQRDKLSERLNASLFWINVGIGLIGAVLLWAAAPVIALYAREPRVVGPITVLALSFPLAGIGIVPQALLVRKMAYKELFLVEVGAAVAAAVVSIGAAWSGMGVWSLVAGSLTMAGLSSGLSWMFSGWLPRGGMDWGEVRSVWSYSLNLTGFVLVNYFSRNTGHLVVQRYLGTAALGYYQMAYSLLLYPLQAMSSVLGRVMFAAFARMRTEPERFRNAMRRYLTLLGAVGFPVFLGLSAVAEPMIRLFLGPKWGPVIPLFMLVAPFGALHAISSPTGQIYLSTGRTDVMLRLGIIGMVVQVLGYFAGLPWGLPGVLLGWAISSVPVAIAGLVVSHRLIESPLQALLRELWSPVSAACIMTAAVVAWRSVLGYWSVPALVDLGSSVILGATVYAAITLWQRASFLQDVIQMLSYSDRSIFLQLRTWLSRYVTVE